MQAHPPPQLLSSILTPFRFPDFKDRPCTCSSACSSSGRILLGHASGFPSLLSCTHTGCRRPHSASCPPVNPQETAELPVSTPASPLLGRSCLGLSCGRPQPQCVPANRGPLDCEQWGWRLILNTERKLWFPS